MADNFNIAKFLKENNLGSYGILGKYVDLHPLKEANKEDLGGWDGDGKNDQYDGKYDDESGPAITNELEKPEQIYTNEWMNDSIDGKKVGNWTCYYEDFQNVIYWLNDKINSEDVVVYATPGWDGAKGIACETSVDSGEQVIDHETIGDNSYPDFESYAEAVTPYLNKVEKKYLGGEELSEALDVRSIAKNLIDAVRSGKDVTIKGLEINNVIPPMGILIAADGTKFKIADLIANDELDTVAIDGESIGATQMKPKSAISRPSGNAQDFQDRFGPGGGYETGMGRYTGD